MVGLQVLNFGLIRYLLEIEGVSGLRGHEFESQRRTCSFHCVERTKKLHRPSKVNGLYTNMFLGADAVNKIKSVCYTVIRHSRWMLKVTYFTLTKLSALFQCRRVMLL